MAAAVEADPGIEPAENISDVREKLDSGEYVAIANANKGNRSSPVWDQFKIIVRKTNEERVGFVICTNPQCSAIYTHSKPGQKNSGTSNLRNHKCRNRYPGKGDESGVYKEAPPQAKEMAKDASISFCLLDGRPYYAVQGRGYEGLLQCGIDIGAKYGRVQAASVIPHRTTISRGVSDKANNLRRKLHPEIELAMKNKMCTGVVDLWTEDMSKVHYMIMCVQYPVVTERGWELRTRVLFFTPFNGSSTGVNLKTHIYKCCLERGFPKELVDNLVFVTDGGADLCLALYDFDRLYCYAHFLNVCLTNSFSLKIYKLQLFTLEAQHIIGQAVAAAEYMVKHKLNDKFCLEVPKGRKRGPFPSKLALLQNLYDNFEQIVEVLEAKSCFLLRSVARPQIQELCDVLSPIEKILATCKTDVLPSKWPLLEPLLEIKEDQHSVFQTDLLTKFNQQFAVLKVFGFIEDCKGVVTYFKQSPVLMNQLQTTLKQCCDTRWNSLFTTLDGIAKQYDKIIEVLQAAKQTEWVKKLQDKPLLEKLCQLLRPFYDETIYVQASKTPTLQLCLPSVEFLKKHCQPMDEREDIASIRALMLGQLTEKSPITQTHKIATFLWPEMRQLKMLTPAEIEEVHVGVRAMLQEVTPDDPVAGRSVDIEPLTKRSRYSDWSEGEGDGNADELIMYLTEPKGDDADLLKWWQTRAFKFPKLSKVALRILSIPATSAEAERGFSFGGFLINDRRNCLDPNSLDDMVYINKNDY